MSARGKATVGFVVVAIVIVGAGAGYAVTHSWALPSTASAATGTGTDGASASSAAALPTGGSDQTAGAAMTSDATQPTAGQTVATDTPVVVTTSTAPVVMTYSGWNASAKQAMAGGYVTGVIEDGGTCTLTLTHAGVSVSAQGPARPDAATTACGGLSIPGSKLSAGTWKAVLSYSSKTSTGSSSSVDIAVTP
jgi:hypothetical protein